MDEQKDTNDKKEHIYLLNKCEPYYWLLDIGAEREMIVTYALIIWCTFLTSLQRWQNYNVHVQKFK